MNEITRKRCELFLESIERIKNVYTWDSKLTCSAAALVYLMNNMQVDETSLEACVNLIKERFSIFSSMRSSAVRTSIAAMLATSEDPELKIDDCAYVYEKLREYFIASSYLPMAAMIICTYSLPENFDVTVDRAAEIYRLAKEYHPFLTGGDDTVIFAMLALSPGSCRDIVEESEDCFALLKKKFFFAGNSIQALSNMLVLGEGDAVEKTDRAMALYDFLKSEGRPYGKSYELPVLGVLVTSMAEVPEIAFEMIEIDDYLKESNMFGAFSGINARMRLMYAGMIAQMDYADSTQMTGAAISATISLVIAMQTSAAAAA